MHRYRIIHVYDSYWPIRPERNIDAGPTELLEALMTITRLGGGIASIERTDDERIIHVFADKGGGHYNLVRVSE